MEWNNIKGVKVVHQERIYALGAIPTSFEALSEALEGLLTIRLSSSRCYGVSVCGDFLLQSEDDFREFAKVCPELNCFEVEDPLQKAAVAVRLTTLVGMKCLHQHSFKVQCFSLETYKTESTSVKLSAGFSFVFIDNGLFITGGSGDQSKLAAVFRDDQLLPQEDLMSDHCSHLSIAFGQSVLVVGGMDLRMNFSRECEVFAQKQWMKLPRLNHAVQFPTGCIMNNTVIVLSGRQLELLRPEQWEVLNLQIPDGFRAASLTQVSEETLLLFGGIGSDRAIELNVGSGKIVEVASVPAKSKYFMQPLKKYRGNVYVWGPNLESIYCYNINCKVWRKVSLELWERRVGMLEVYHRGKHSIAFTNMWKLPLSLIREICGKYL